MRLSDVAKRWLVSAGLTIFLSVNVLAFLAIPQRANAQADAAITSAFTAKWTWEKIESNLYSSLLASLINGASYFMRKIAYDTARYVASGGKGQGALAFQNGAGAYFAEVAGNTAGEIIDQFGKPFGLDLCKPPDLKVQAYLQVSLRRIYDQNAGGPQPSCSFQQLTDNWGNYQEQYKQQGKDIGQAFANSLRVNQGDFGIALGLAAKVDRNVTQAKAGAQTDRQEGNGFKPLTNLISGEIKTPAQVIQSETESVSGKKQTELSFQQLNGIYGSGALQIIPMAASVFLNTLTSQLLDSVLSGGLFSTGGGDGSSVLDAYGSAVNRNRELAEKAFSYLITSLPTQEATYDILAQYSSCPEDGRLAGVNNCVINSRLRQALDRSLNNGTPLTIADAIKEGFLDPNAELIPPTREADNSNKVGCMSDKRFCYSNIQKMRKVRILPLGFEIAALKSDPDQPWKLGQVVAGFEDCERTNGVARPSATKPFCHLIDPNWTLKVPEAQCQAQVITEQLETETAPNRREECADISTCLAKDDKGACISYGHCTQEKNVWRLGAASCSEQYNTCRTFVNTRDNSVVSYLTRTLDYGECTQESVGCRAYSTELSGGAWVPSAAANTSLKYIGRSQTMYFGDTVKNFACAPESEGSTAFYPLLATGAKSDAPVYLKKAPDYLGCYDTNPATAQIEFANTEADLAKLSSAAQCNSFAGACVASEVGCRKYQPAEAGAPELTAKIGANSCNVACIGYDTFKQEVSAFEKESFPLHFIPGQAVSCPTDEKYVGCSEFTNLDSAAGGGETREYYSSLKYCEKPLTDGSNVKTYYTWEGTVSQGYVLRVHKLLPLRPADQTLIENYALGPEAVGQFMAGTPAYASDLRSDLEKWLVKCNQTNYQIGLNDPFSLNRADADCRAFYDDAGKIYYRLLAQTVSVDQACHPLRKTEASLTLDSALSGVGLQTSCENRGGLWDPGTNQCQRCVGGGKFKDGACVYQTISRPGESVSCDGPANDKSKYNGCRAYTGNTVGNVQNVLLEEGTFEPASAEATALLAAKAGWSAGTVKPESIQVGQYSLNVNTNDPTLSYNFASNTLKTGESYELQFWARGDVNNLTISLVQGQTTNLFTFDPVAKADLKLSISPEWRPYRLGPIQFTGDGFATDVRLSFTKEVAANRQYYLDNVQVTRLAAKKTLIKNSWRAPNDGREVPLLCDSNPTDAYPGEALGCREYTDLTAGKTTQATGFEKLCRPQAAGCSALYDSHNTLDTEKTTVFNAWCAKAQEGVCTLKYGTVTLGTCVVKSGEAGCFVDSLELDFGQSLPTTSTVKSTVIVPADTASSTPVFLTDRPEFRLADGSQLGCQKVALESQNLPTAGANPASSTAFTFSQSFFRNDPALYDQILCRDDLVGCSEFKAGSEVRYARDPKLIGNKLCSYKQDFQISGGTKVSGWFMDGVGKCSAGTTVGNLCRTDNDCGGTAGSCTGVGEVACYEDNILAGGDYGIWSQKTANYKGFVGQCPAEANNCTELLDPADKSDTEPSGKAYYAILDEAFRSRSAVCDGKASLKGGCVLFNQTEVPNKLFNAQATYQESVNQNNKAVVPVSNATNDTNIILKVDRDRQCSEWLACKASMTVQDPATGKTKQLCYQYSACNKLGPSGACEEWVTVDKVASQRLTENVYVGRPTNWQAADYTGYSLFNKYPVSDYTYVNFEGDIKSYLAYEIPESVLAENPEAAACIIDGVNQPDGNACGDLGGRCYQARCIYPIGGSFNSAISSSTANNIKDFLNPGICKSYPEKSSPYSQGVALSQKPQGEEIKYLNKDQAGEVSRVEFINKRPEYSGANICQGENGPETCSCEYQKVSYKSGQTDYWSINGTTVLPEGICTAGEVKKPNMPIESDAMISTIGQPCSQNLDCGTGGACTPMNRKELRVGQRGFCLEYDRSTPLGVEINQTTGEKKINYACLTWLPIETSASSFDLYNSSLDAGYNPQVDGLAASNGSGGELYCLATQATQPTAATYSDSWFKEVDGRPNFSGSVSASNDPKPQSSYQNVNYFFEHHWNDQNSEYTRPALEKCRTTNDGDYNAETNIGGALCKTDATILASRIDRWAKKAMGTNAILLRVEGGLLATRMTIEDAGLVWRSENTAGVAGGNLNRANKDVKIIYSLAPAVHGCRMEYGTVMHPPRCFDKAACNEGGSPNNYYLSYLQKPKLEPISVSSANCIDADSGAADNQSEDEKNTYAISSVYYSPGPTMSEDLMPENKRNYVYRTEYESKMNEADLEKVCFVPMAFTEGKHSNQIRLPLFGTDDFCINFSNSKVNGVTPIHEAANSYGFFNAGVYNSPTRDALLWTYVLEGDQLKGMNFNDYNKEQHYSEIPEAVALDARNTIAKRYVGVVFNGYTGGNDLQLNAQCAPKFAQKAVSAWVQQNKDQTKPAADAFFATAQNDPFSHPYALDVLTGEAASPCSLRSKDFLAIGLDFNSNGEFLGYVSRWAVPQGFDSTQERDGDVFQDRPSGYKFAVVAMRKNQCISFAQVHESDQVKLLSGQSVNKAKTNNIWQGNTNFKPTGLSALKRETLQGPFGSTRLSGAAIFDPWKLRTYSFYEALDGVPYSCAGGLNGGNDPCLTLGTIPGFDGAIKAQLTAVAKSTADRFQLLDKARTTLLSFFARINYEREIGPVSGGLGVETHYLSTDDKYVPTIKEMPATDTSANASANAPVIYSLNPATCRNGGVGINCTAGEYNAFSISGRNYTMTDYDDDGRAEEDLNFDGSPDPIIARKSYTAVMQFFAGADDNHMPLKSIKIDWDDNKDTFVRNGLYKNRKPFCEIESIPGEPLVGHCDDPDTSDGTSPLTCRVTKQGDKLVGNNADCAANSVAGDEAKCVLQSFRQFGDLERSCKAGYFEFINQYSCSTALTNIEGIGETVAGLQGLISAEARERVSAMMPSGTDVNTAKVCVYKPRVQVKDNWGWCNGTCKHPGGQVGYGCYDNFNNETDQCDNSVAVENQDPFTEYKGWIILLP